MSSIRALADSRKAVSNALSRYLPDADADRFQTLVTRHVAEFDDTDHGAERPAGDVWFASAPGRTELAGNHTDHNQGRVLAASINLDSIAAVVPRSDSTVRLASDGFPLVEVDIADTQPRPDERESTAALVRGVAAGFARYGYRTGGFDATMSSTVLPGSGLSSSASVEVLIGTIFSALLNEGTVNATRVAQIGQFAENTFFGKPSGLMDQVACATGGAVAIDFADPAEPVIERVDVSFDGAGLALLVVDTGANHADLTDEYAAIPADMKALAGALGGGVLRDVGREAFFRAIPLLRRQVGDRAVARGIHYFDENDRVEAMVQALRDRDFERYVGLMAESGKSSGIVLQNCAPVGSPGDQGVVIALALTEHFFASQSLGGSGRAACRVHGGGFAGTIQVLLPARLVDSYRRFIAEYLGDGAVTRLTLRGTGALAFRAQ